MMILYNDEQSKRTSDSFHLIFLHNHWHVVACGYLCRVADAAEGRQVIAARQASLKMTTPHIDKP